MRESLISFLRRHTTVYRVARKVYRGFISRLGSLIGTRFEERRWARRSSSLAGGCDELNHPHRVFLVERIANFSPFQSLLEVGCGNGPNLYLLAKRFPEAELRGVDINPWSVRNGDEWFKREGVSNVKLSVGKADELESFPDKSFDIVLTDAVLMYVGPDKIRKVVKDMVRIVRRALILVEWHSFDSRNPLGVFERHWRRNYENLLKEFVSEGNVQAFKLPDEAGFEDEMWRKWGALIEAQIE